jgi:hypothetical protein
MMIMLRANRWVSRRGSTRTHRRDSRSFRPNIDGLESRVVLSSVALHQIADAQTSPVGEEVALDGNVAYVVGTEGIDVVDVSNLSKPTVLATIGQGAVVPGGMDFAQVAGDELVVVSQQPSDASGLSLLIYSLSPNPTKPTLISNTSIDLAYATGLFVQGNTAFVSTYGNFYSGSALSGQFGDFAAIDISHPATPHLESLLFNAGSAPYMGSNSENAAVPVSSTVAYVAGTTSTGAVPKGQLTTPGEGRLLIVNTSNPASLSLEKPVGQLLIPGTNRLLAIAVDGDRALLVGSTDGYSTDGLVQGNITFTVLDISDPLAPAIVGNTLVTTNTDANRVQNANLSDAFGGEAVAMGNGVFAVSETLWNGSPVIEEVNINTPSALVTTPIAVPSDVHRMAVSGSQLYATSISGLLVYTTQTGNPTSIVTVLPATESAPSFPVSWSGSDGGGPGIASYSIFVSDNGGPFVPWLTATSQNSATYNGQHGHTYSFYSVATDALGLVQPTPSTAQATTKVNALPPPVVNVTGVLKYSNPKHQIVAISLIFSQAVNSREADSTGTYHLVEAGTGGSFTAKNASVIRLKSAVYSSATNSVTLMPSKPFSLTKPVELIIYGSGPSGLKDSHGLYIDGDHNGVPGGNAVVILSSSGAKIEAIPL